MTYLVLGLHFALHSLISYLAHAHVTANFVIVVGLRILPPSNGAAVTAPSPE